MKNRMIKWAVALFACGALLAGCNDDEKGGEGTPTASKTVEAFRKQFPGATNVQWSKKQGYDVAVFTLATRAAAARNSAWYPEGGTTLAYVNLEIRLDQLRQEAPAVAQAWSESPYKTQGYRLDDIDKRTYADAEPTYKLEIESSTEERELIYKLDGTLLSDYPDTDAEDEDDEDQPSPQSILSFLQTNVPDALIVECDTEHESGTTVYEVEVIYRNEESSLFFDEKYAFIHAVSEIDEDDLEKPGMLPAPVLAKIAELSADAEIGDVAKMYMTIADFNSGENALYAVMMEDYETDRETLYVFDAEGNPIEA